MLSDEGKHQEEDCHSGYENAWPDLRSVGMGSLAKRRIQRIFQVTPIDEVMHSGRLRRFGHVQRTDVNGEPHSARTRRRVRSKKARHHQIKDDMTGVGVTQNMDLLRLVGNVDRAAS